MTGLTARFIDRFLSGDSGLKRYAGEVLPRLTRTWRGSAGQALPERYADLYRAVDVEIEAAKQKTASALPCAKGCNHCCRFPRIFVTRYEGVLLVQFIEQQSPERRAPIVERITAADRPSGSGTACALLTDAGCSVYTSRPLPCRGFHSLSEPACASHLNGSGPSPPNLASTRVIEFAALEVTNARRHSPLFEINALLHRIYSDPQKIVLWRAGTPTEESDLATAAGEF
jgi:hypothetical protein